MKMPLTLLGLVFLVMSQAIPSDAKSLPLQSNDAVLVPVNEDGPVITGPGGQLMAESAHPASNQDEGEEADPSNAVIKVPVGPAEPLAPPMIQVQDPVVPMLRQVDPDVTPNPEVPDAMTTVAAESSGSSMIWIVVGVLAVVLIGLVIGVTIFCIRRKKRKNQAAVTAIVPASDSATPAVVEAPAP